MSMRDEYRTKAAKFHARALYEPSPRLRTQYENLAKSYLRLAEQADRHAQLDTVYEPPSPMNDNLDRKR
jgi:hypothetical protein